MICDDCPMRLFNKHYNLKGIGNPYYGNCIVVPNVDYNAYKKGDMSFSKQIEIIKSIVSPTGVLENLYIVPLIRCNETIACELNDDIYRRCITYFAQDVSKYNFTKILLLGEAATRFTQCSIKDNLNNLIISPNKRYYNVNYSPLIKYVDEDKFEIFKQYLKKWHHCVNTRYSNYNVIRL